MESLLSFGEWLRQSRDGLGLTRKEFAKRVGCSVSTLRKIENGERRPSGQIAELIASSLNIPTTDRSTFVRVARGEWNVDRLLPLSDQTAGQNISPVPKAPTLHANLPVLPTPLIGRQREMHQLSQLLRDPECHLVTLVGPGGIGKTRLAIETASQVQDAFVDGVYLVPLAPVTTTDFIMPLIADALGFVFQSASPGDPKAQLFGYLKEKQLLLLLDNFEHLVAESGVDLLPELLAIAPQVKLLVTSRESLGLQSEWIVEVHGLPVPENPPTEELAQDTSVELFLQQARRAHVEFNATHQDLLAVLRICRQVDGMPLALELAAAWVRTLTCKEIADEIEHGLGFLSISARDLPPRHRSMRAVFDHSWKLLTKEEQDILLRLSIFKGGFRRDAAEQVAEATLPLLSTLVTKSLIRRSGAGRYDLHELIRQFAADRFAEHPEERAAMQAHHASYYLRYFAQADGRLRSSAQGEALAELTTEMDNFRVAWDWAVTQGEFALIEQTLRTLTRFYDTRGWLQEGLDTLGRAVSALEAAVERSQPDRTSQVALGHLLASRSVLTSRLGQYERAQTMLECSLEILRPLNEPHVLVEALTFFGIVSEITGNYPKALELYSEGLETATAIGDHWFAALCLTCHIGLLGVTQNIVEPKTTYERLRSVVDDWRAIGDPRFTAYGLNILSWNALTLGRYDEARAALEESAALSRSVGDRWGLGFAYRGLGIIAQTQDEHLQAIDMFHQSLDTFTELGARQDVARLLSEMSRSFFALGNDVEAEHGWRESLRIAMETQGTFIALEALVGFASLYMKWGNPERAYEMLMFVSNHPVSFQDTRDRALHLRTELEKEFPPLQIETLQARAEGKALDLVVKDLLK
jgi:predicted ATPase/transcriptional regulator with XRE-family HTH domain